MREAAHLDAPERVREARRGRRSASSRALEAPARRAARARRRGAGRPASGGPRRRSARRHGALMPRASRWPRSRRTSSASAAASSASGRRSGSADGRSAAPGPARMSRARAGTTRLHADQRERHHRHPRVEGQHELPALEGLRPRRRGCASPPGKTTTLVPPRMRSAARCRGSCGRGRRSCGRWPTWPPSVEVEAHHRDQVQRALVDDAEVHGQIARTGSGCRARSRGSRRRRPAPRAVLRAGDVTSTPQRPQDERPHSP